MSILIDKSMCVGCGKCMDVCPGNLIKRNSEGKAYIRHPGDCWGCASCVKTCGMDAICLYLGPDMGGLGATLTVEIKGPIREWKVKDVKGQETTIRVDQRKSNQY